MKKIIEQLNDIDKNTPEGRMLLAAIIQLTTQHFPNKSPDEVIGLLEQVAVKCVDEVGSLKSCQVSDTPFTDAIKKAVNQSEEIKAHNLKNLRDAGEVIFKAGKEVLPSCAMKDLEVTLVAIYRQLSGQ
jgi:hypothetical protein